MASSLRLVANPYSAQEANAFLHAVRSRLPVKSVPVGSLDEFDRLNAIHQRTGPEIYDLFLAAVMISHGITTICTYDLSAFRLADLTPLEPARVLQLYPDNF
ncbi:MAG: PIN domain-containing protein [Candidatus Dormibacteraceae bacterium]